MGARTLSQSDLRGVAIRFADALATYQEEINALNVYPVPDGDTGTNLRLTMESVRKALETAEDPAAAIVRGSLMGARGNSGVIMSQVLRGLCEGWGKGLPAALRTATGHAYGAVMHPQEGTILTVVRESAEEAEALDGDDPVEAVRRVLERARRSLAATPEQLPVLKAAGVVDAGGRGFVLLLECLLEVLDGTPPAAPAVPARSAAEAATGARAEHGSLEFNYEVQFLFEVDDEAAREFRHTLDRYGDCVLVVGSDGLYNVHVHTNQVGPVIEEALGIGRPRGIDVTYLEGQVAELERHEAAVRARITGDSDAPRDDVGLVAVGSGDGILTILRSLGVRGLVPGGQTFNPSAEEILNGIREANASSVIVLPNNKNVIGSARTAAEIAVEEGAAERAEVVPTESPLQAFSALVAYDPDASFEDNIAAMSEGGLHTKHAEVAYAVRPARTPAGDVREGQCIGLWGGEIRSISDDAPDAVIGVVGHMLAEGDSLATLVYGADVDEWDAHALGKKLAERYGIEVEVHRGGQPHYPYLIGVE